MAKLLPMPPLRVVLVWNGTALDEKVFRFNQPVRIGTTPQDDFVVPATAIGAGHALFEPGPDGTTWHIGLQSGMGGKLHLDGVDVAVSDFLGESQRGGHGGRIQPIGRHDWGIVALDPENSVAIFYQHLGDVPHVGTGLSWMDRFFGQGLAFSAIIHLTLLILAFIVYEAEDLLDVDPPPSTAIAKLLFDKPPEPEPEKKEKNVRKVREDDASKKAAGKEGKIGDKDAKIEKTVIPKGPRDQIAAKVTKTGLLGALQPSKQNSALKSLLSDTPNADVTTALAGVKGANLQVGRGSGGMGLKGDGGGGGGKGPGQLMGVGDLAVGGGGKGPRATGSGGGHVGKETKVGVTSGTPSSDGGLSKEQILKVVQSHAAAIQFCYEKELQRFPHLAGKVTIDWKVDLDGRVQLAKLGSSSLSNPSAESCMVRQIKAWQFPKPNGVVCNVSFPFFFKGQ
jgi:hypothetical protein